jgi:hypothetical protein
MMLPLVKELLLKLKASLTVNMESLDSQALFINVVLDYSTSQICQSLRSDTRWNPLCEIMSTFTTMTVRTTLWFFFSSFLLFFGLDLFGLTQSSHNNNGDDNKKETEEKSFSTPIKKRMERNLNRVHERTEKEDILEIDTDKRLEMESQMLQQKLYLSEVQRRQALSAAIDEKNRNLEVPPLVSCSSFFLFFFFFCVCVDSLFSSLCIQYHWRRILRMLKNERGPWGNPDSKGFLFLVLSLFFVGTYLLVDGCSVLEARQDRKLFENALETEEELQLYRPSRCRLGAALPGTERRRGERTGIRTCQTPAESQRR